MKVHLSRKLPFAFLFIIFVFFGLVYAQIPGDRSCEFNFTTLTFKGSSLEQARCLLRKVKFQAVLEEQPLPAFLERIIDQDVQITKEALRAYLKRVKPEIKEDKIGGSLDAAISKGDSNKSDITARYFVIHDTSFPNLCKVTSFPADINESSWIFERTKWNEAETYSNSGQAHLYITRTGDTVAPRGGTEIPKERMFSTPWRATSLEMTNVRSRGMFLHIENVQPRRCNDAWIVDGRCKLVKVKDKKTGKLENKCTNDNVAPDPGLTDAQLEKLALVYIAASVRRGKWLIPAFHAAVDMGISGGHDDPQNFVLQKWADKICLIVKELGGQCPIGG